MHHSESCARTTPTIAATWQMIAALRLFLLAEAPEGGREACNEGLSGEGDPRPRGLAALLDTIQLRFQPMMDLRRFSPCALRPGVASDLGPSVKP
jgi:hypothetical protein